MMKYLLSILTILFCLNNHLYAGDKEKEKLIVANPINLNYRFILNGTSREAADPVIEYYKGKYYLFASKSGGYWSSPDLCNWKYIPCKSIKNIEDYAPAILVYDDVIYYQGCGKPVIFKTTNPDEDNWEQVDIDVHAQGGFDLTFFKDDDGRVYLYGGCSPKDPITGVEVDPKNGFKVIGTPKNLIMHREQEFGWEVFGDNNETGKPGWNEGPCMIKRNGKYYLQYATPGTIFRTYCDAVYVAEHPLGPFRCVDGAPFSLKPGGFITGAGHGHTFKDKYENYWHVTTMKISCRHRYERRIGLFPVYFDDNGHMYSHTVWTDYPFYIPTEQVDFSKNNCSMGWHMLSKGKNVSASSELPQHKASNASDEQIESWWSAASGKIGEWYQVDLGKTMEVKAIQVNFADHDLKMSSIPYCYQYQIESSKNGANWQLLIDRTTNTKDMPHELITLNKSINTRFIRIRNTKEVPGKFSLHDFRIFGNGKGKLPHKVSGLQIQRDKDDKRIYHLTWNSDIKATGYIVRWGIDKNQLNYSEMVYTNTFEGRFFRSDMEYYFSVDTFNESGIVSSKYVAK